MDNEYIVLEYAKSRQRELWDTAERIQQARLAKAAASQRHARGVSLFKQFCSMWNGRVQGMKKPVTEHATA